jgi:hypothetical protein
MRSLLLVNSLHLVLKPHPVRKVHRVRKLRLMCSLHLVLRKKRPKPKSALGSDPLTATYCVNLFEV